MFSHFAVAQGFPIPPRREERGIELPYHIMTTFGKIRYPETRAQGIVLVGLSTVLVPLSRNKRCVQWHYTSEDETGEQVSLDVLMDKQGLEGADVLVGCGKDLLNDFRETTTRHFVGYCENVQIHLGTQGSSYDRAVAPPINIAETAGTEIRYNRSIRPNLLSLGAGLGAGLSWAGLGTSFSLPKSKKQELVRDDELLSELVEKSKDHVSILYDAKEKIGWFVSELSVILHLVHSWAAQNMGENYTGQLPHAQPLGDGGQAALQAIMEGRSAALRDVWNTSEAITLEQRVRSTYLSFRALKQKLVKQDRETVKAPNWPKKRLYGYNFTHLSELCDNVDRIKVTIESDLSGGWESIPRNEPEILVVMTHDIGQVIHPVRNAPLCDSWKPAPSGMYLLVASVPCIVKWSRHLRAGEYTSMLSAKHYCHRRGSVFEPFAGNSQEGCQRIQKLSSSRPKSKDESLWFEASCKDGAVVFGGDAAIKRHLRHSCTMETAGPSEPATTNSTVPRSTLSGSNLPSPSIRTETPVPVS